MNEDLNQRLFLKYQDGDLDAIVEIIELERAQLFDYLIRMTGQHDRSLATIDEVVKALRSEDLAQNFGDYESLKVKVFATARNFSQHIWNADISALENQGFAELDEDDLRASLQNIEAFMAKLPGVDRELLLLHGRYGFSVVDAAAVLNRDSEFCSDRISMLFLDLKNILPTIDGSVRELLGALPHHPISGNANLGTVALSQIMGDMGKVRRSWAYYQNLILIVLLFVLLGSLYYLYF